MIESEINNTNEDNERYVDAVMMMYSLIKYHDKYAKTAATFWNYQKIDLNDNITDSESFKLYAKIIARATANGNTKDVEIMVSLKYLSYFWRQYL